MGTLGKVGLKSVHVFSQMRSVSALFLKQMCGYWAVVEGSAAEFRVNLFSRVALLRVECGVAQTGFAE